MGTIFEVILITLLVVISVYYLKKLDKKIGLTMALQGLCNIVYKNYPWLIFGFLLWLIIIYLRFGTPT